MDQGREPYTVYSYTITACSGAGCKESMPASQRTDEAAPTQVNPPTLTALSAIAIRIDWNVPAIPNGVIIGFKLYEGNTLIYSGQDHSFTVSAKKPYTEYTFSIAACTKSGCTRSLSAKVRTLERPPGAMAAPVATVAGSRTVRVEWNPPAEPNGVVLHYILSRNGIVIYNGSDVRYNDYNVAPYTVYDYKVYAVNNAGRGVDSPIGSNLPTNPGAPDNITAPSLTVLGSNSIRVQWKMPGRPNGNIIKYYVLYNKKVEDASVALETVLGGLEPYTLYEVRIKACTNVACSVGETAKARTSEAAPALQGRPVFPSESIKARKVQVTWDEPGKPNGFIVLYTLYRRKVIRSAGVPISYGPIISTYNASNGTQLLFTDNTVEPYSEYEYRVTSRNSKWSTTSGWAVVKTLPDVPDNVSSPQITKKFKDRLEVLIKAPSKPNGEIRNYILRISGTNVSEGLELSRVISNLEPFTLYSIRVSACTDAGCTLSPEATGRTSEGIPTQFSAPTIVQIQSESVELTWNEPAKPNGVPIRLVLVMISSSY
jgi:usherin